VDSSKCIDYDVITSSASSHTSTKTSLLAANCCCYGVLLPLREISDDLKTPSKVGQIANESNRS